MHSDTRDPAGALLASYAYSRDEGRLEEALEAIEHAELAFRRNSAYEEDASLPNLAAALNNTGVALLAHSEPAKAEPLIAELTHTPNNDAPSAKKRF